ncbi:MAG: EamA family transporter [Candidatus Nitrohelix vancouverensis]|uniref:EamA family transporter n=1 Tax=Candidatus Nitrohelix vancouverensis TaxID=2705534 RepID=A0A7T0C388_9BACT|nr:MAG: EamA family transporter [Candidatus Nitrohelix vancouverensis]
MSLVNISLILISCLFHAYWNILTRSSADSRFFSALKGSWIILMASVFFLIFGVEGYSAELWGWAILSGVLHGLYIFCLSRAYHTEDISYVYPIARSAPVFVPVGAFFLLGERLSVFEWIAVLMIVVAIYVLHFDGHLIKGAVNLWNAMRHQHLRWAYFTLIMVVSYSLVDKKGMDHFLQLFPEDGLRNGVAFFFLESLVCFALYNSYLFLSFNRSDILQVWKGEWRKGILGGIATLGSYGVICIVLQFEDVSAVVSLRQISVFLVIYWGCWINNEGFGAKRMLAGALIFIGVALMSLEH